MPIEKRQVLIASCYWCRLAQRTTLDKTEEEFTRFLREKGWWISADENVCPTCISEYNKMMDKEAAGDV